MGGCGTTMHTTSVEDTTSFLNISTEIILSLIIPKLLEIHFINQSFMKQIPASVTEKRCTINKSAIWISKTTNKLTSLVPINDLAAKDQNIFFSETLERWCTINKSAKSA